jgi:hypothetical protein
VQSKSSSGGAVLAVEADILVNISLCYYFANLQKLAMPALSPTMTQVR